ncbi:NYN domain-containing protein [Hirsutella rhossiliensis]|uniref:NYN domain-containing protein n=1 Tax=Hirsutella rhossiliensis TaxID=111463 RepID=A0A9P8MWC2_9HYPO|nr:NYN domain-containing protein [Hirsutella rhossiliensis]KAH0962394.1 NYN domain-containing protein [Hirsutella rhossiliensis]
MTRPVLAEIEKYGTAFVKRAYGDWTGMTPTGWKFHLLENSIQPIQQFACTHGKNATDSAMVIDTMDLLYSGRFDGSCIVSSDSDFTRLASRIRESGLHACDKFIYVDNIAPKDGPISHTDGVTNRPASEGQSDVPD